MVHQPDSSIPLTFLCAIFLHLHRFGNSVIISNIAVAWNLLPTDHININNDKRSLLKKEFQATYERKTKEKQKENQRLRAIVVYWCIPALYPQLMCKITQMWKCTVESAAPLSTVVQSVRECNDTSGRSYACSMVTIIINRMEKQKHNTQYQIDEQYTCKVSLHCYSCIGSRTLQ